MIEDAANCVVVSEFEKVAELAAILEIVREPKGFVIAVELRLMKGTCWAWMLVNTLRLLVWTPFDAVIFCVLTLGAEMGAEKRRSWPR
jgi:hypothetical protein